MRREYKILAKFALAAALVILALLPSPIWQGNPLENAAMAVAYIAGTVLSAIAGKIGILVATLSNARTAEGAQKGIKPAFLIGFRGGAVMGLLVVGFSLLGVAVVLMLTGDSGILLGFSFGASSLALFAKAGGGIFTKTADISADLTGKVEMGIRRTTRATRLSSPITSATTWATWPAWAPTCSTRTWPRWPRRS